MKLSQLFEAIFHVDDAVDYIFEKAFGDFFRGIEKFKKGGDISKVFVDLDITDFSMAEIKKNIKNEYVQRSMIIFPIEIEAGILTEGSRYVPTKNLITISFNTDLYRLLLMALSNNWTYDMMMQNIQSHRRPNAEAEFSGNKVRGSIAHELSHWIDDVSHKRHITKMIEKAQMFRDEQQDQASTTKTLLRGKPDIYMTDYEINAVVHAISQLKREFDENKWNTMTFDDLLDSDPALNNTYMRIRDTLTEKDLKEWKRTVFSRLHRERLLGRNMRYRRY